MEFASWNYRAIGTDDGEGGRMYSFHEVHYDSDGKIVAYSAFPCQLVWSNDEEAQRLLDRLREACAKPALELSELTMLPFLADGGR